MSRCNGSTFTIVAVGVAATFDVDAEVAVVAIEVVVDVVAGDVITVDVEVKVAVVAEKLSGLKFIGYPSVPSRPV